MSIITDQYFNPPDQFMSLVQSKLKKGEIYKNYRELCIQLDLPVMTGNQLKHHQSAWKCFFSFHKIEGKKSIMIDEIYPMPKEYIPEKQKQYYIKADKDNREIYQPTLKKLVLGLVPKYGYTMTISTSKLLYETGFVNINYLNIADKISKDIDTGNINSNTYNLMLLVSWINKISIHGYLEKTINKLQKTGYIISDSRVDLIKKEGDDNFHEPNEQELEIINNYMVKEEIISSNAKKKGYALKYYIHKMMTKELYNCLGIIEIRPFWKIEFDPNKKYTTINSKDKQKFVNFINNGMMPKYQKYIINSISNGYDKNMKTYKNSKELQDKYKQPYQIVKGKDKAQCIKDTEFLITKYCQIYE